MSDDVVIRVEALGKRYSIRHQRDGGYKTLREALTGRAKRLFQRNGHSAARSPISQLPSSTTSPRTSKEDFWALKNVSFEVKRGEVVGIIGRNGAGKSTLLKILSRITEPTEGKVRIKGRVASLLEVGTGFHPELTGRENIYLNGAILGMNRAEITGKFDEIVAFAETQRFLDTPVKRYSSGMYVRLAFAVAAHLEPEILVVDEVLAVGDAEFQKKCLGKMSEVSRGGRTVLFVSHNMVAIQRLCSRAMFMDQGCLKQAGSVSDVVASYISTGAGDNYVASGDRAGPYVACAKLLTEAPRTDREIQILVQWKLPVAIRNIKIGVGFNTSDGQRIFDSIPEDFGMTIPSDAGSYQAIFAVPPNTLMAKHYAVSVGLWISPSGGNSQVFDHVNPALRFSVEPASLGPYAHQQTREGLVHIPTCSWHFETHKREAHSDQTSPQRHSDHE
jgi:lipopolysaccharide transport system ATP-binding protein